ncbi:MAG: ATP-binding protein [Candidatus Magnetomorum sp.]|nr:ATP-binding protein [Candidatus Magnetomorum sp.]
MKKEDITKFIIEWQNHILQIKGIKRRIENDVFESIGSKPIKIITGFRRSGKSFFVQQIAKKLIESTLIPVTNILYINFEDFRVLEINSPEKLDAIYQVFIHEIVQKDHQKIIIFDEIQKVNMWDRFIRTLYEKEQDIQIVLTGSNSELLSSELGSNLAGRFIEFSIQPFDFQEYLTYHHIAFSDHLDYYRNRKEINRHFSNYVKFGGLPESLTITNEKARISYMEGIISKVILDDIINRFRVKNSMVIEKILTYLLSSPGNIISFKKIGNYLKILGLRVKQETLINYVQFMIKTFAIHELNKFDWKLGKIFSTTRKYYAVDTGLLNLSVDRHENYSKRLENIVFTKLLASTKQLYFGALPSGKEIDFIAQNKQGNYTKFQITQELQTNNFDREFSSFDLKDTYLSEGNNYLLVLDDVDEAIKYKQITIQKKSIIRWLLAN